MKWNLKLTYHMATDRELTHIKLHHNWKGNIYYNLHDVNGHPMDDAGKMTNYPTIGEWSLKFDPPITGVGSIKIYEGATE